MPSPPVGADIESICGKCGDVWHVVAAKVGDKVMKVVCKQCGNQHRHRPPEGTATATATRTTSTTSAPRTTAPRTSRAKAAPVPEGPLVEADPNKPVRPYRPLEAYATGERIDHPTFGRGVVESSPGPGKIQVYFTGGRRILAAAKGGSTLAPPPPRRAGD